MIVSSTVIVIIETFQLSSARMYCILPMTYVYILHLIEHSVHNYTQKCTSSTVNVLQL